MVWGYTDPDGNSRPRTRISDTASFYNRGNVFIEDNVFIGHYTILDGTERLTIREGVQVSASARILTHSSHVSIRLLGRHYQEVPEDEKPGYKRGAVEIGKYAFLAIDCNILPGVSIGKGAVIAAGSTVLEDVPDFAMVRGVPAEVVGDTRELDAPFLEDERLRAWYEEWAQ